jgi:sulfatase modifying factor 1
MTRWQILALLGVGCIAVTSVVGIARKRHRSPNHCAKGWVSIGPRCCFDGQTFNAGSCVGPARICPPGFHETAPRGCAIDAKRVRISATTLSMGPNDWQSEPLAPVASSVPEFWVDRAEVTVEQWNAAIAKARPSLRIDGEPGQPVRSVTPEQAAGYCSQNHGRLPRLSERMALCAGAQARRFPWGQTGLVCRRAAFGIVDGPCGERGREPDVTGSHPDGQSPEGVLDLSGNVAEFAVDDRGRAWACGGSFRSSTALELKSWACVLISAPADDIGFRCVYDVTPATR